MKTIERGQKYKAIEYNEACLKINEVTAYFDEFFHHYDAILTPSACGEAPKDLKITGNPIFCTIWTYCGMPSISLPLLQGKKIKTSYRNTISFLLFMMMKDYLEMQLG